MTAKRTDTCTSLLYLFEFSFILHVYASYFGRQFPFSLIKGAKQLYVRDGTQNQYGWRQRARFSIRIFAGVYIHL